MNASDIKYDTPIEVTAVQYARLMNKCGGLIAGQKKDGKYYIKVWMMKYVDHIVAIWQSTL